MCRSEGTNAGSVYQPRPSRMNRADQDCRPLGGKWKGLLQQLDDVGRAE